MIMARETMVLRLPWGYRKTEITPAILREMADQLELALDKGYYVTDNIEHWDDQSGMNYPETLTRGGAGESTEFEIHLGRLSHT